MFGLFKSTTSRVKVVDKVWMSRRAKLNACANMLQVSSTCLFIAWFEETFRELQSALSLVENTDNLLLASDADTEKIRDRMVVFAEHYPLLHVEQDLFLRLNLNEIPVLSSLDEPFFERFGGGRTIELMRQLGMKEDEVVGHSMITKSIRNAQEKIAKQVLSDQKANSQREWFALNMK